MHLLLLDRLLRLQVGTIGVVEADFQLGDLDLHLLLDARHLGLEFGFGVGQSGAEGLDFDGELFP